MTDVDPEQQIQPVGPESSWFKRNALRIKRGLGAFALVGTLAASYAGWRVGAHIEQDGNKGDLALATGYTDCIQTVRRLSPDGARATVRFASLTEQEQANCGFGDVQSSVRTQLRLHSVGEHYLDGSIDVSSAVIDADVTLPSETELAHAVESLNSSGNTFSHGSEVAFAGMGVFYGGLILGAGSAATYTVMAKHDRRHHGPENLQPAIAAA